jgi:hypothetical protein
MSVIAHAHLLLCSVPSALALGASLLLDFGTEASFDAKTSLALIAGVKCEQDVRQTAPCNTGASCNQEGEVNKSQARPPY